MRQTKTQRAQAQGNGIADVVAKASEALKLPVPNNTDTARQTRLAEAVMRKDRLVLQALAK